MTFNKMTSDPVGDADRYMNELELAADEADEAAHQRWHELWLKLQTRDGVVEVIADFDMDEAIFAMVALLAQWKARINHMDKWNHDIMADVLVQMLELMDKRIVEISNE